MYDYFISKQFNINPFYEVFFSLLKKMTAKE
jgi:hypothetical protein